MNPEQLFLSEKNLPYYIQSRHFYSAIGEWKSELIAEGRVYLWIAAKQYDPSKGEFFSYAYAQVLGGMMNLRTTRKRLKRKKPERMFSIDQTLENGDSLEDLYGRYVSAEEEAQWNEYVRECKNHPLLSLRLKGYGRQKVAEMSGMNVWKCDRDTRKAMTRLMQGLPI